MGPAPEKSQNAMVSPPSQAIQRPSGANANRDTVVGNPLILKSSPPGTFQPCNVASWLPPTTQRPFGATASPAMAPGAARCSTTRSRAGSRIVTPR